MFDLLLRANTAKENKRATMALITLTCANRVKTVKVILVENHSKRIPIKFSLIRTTGFREEAFKKNIILPGDLIF